MTRNAVTFNLCCLKKRKEKKNKLYLEGSVVPECQLQRVLSALRSLVVLEPLPRGKPSSPREGQRVS